MLWMGFFELSSLPLLALLYLRFLPFDLFWKFVWWLWFSVLVMIIFVLAGPFETPSRARTTFEHAIVFECCINHLPLLLISSAAFVRRSFIGDRPLLYFLMSIWVYVEWFPLSWNGSIILCDLFYRTNGTIGVWMKYTVHNVIHYKTNEVIVVWWMKLVAFFVIFLTSTNC